MKDKFKSYSFWMSVTAAVILVINNIGKVLGFEVDSKVITQIVDSICGVLILFGVITMAKNNKNNENDIEQEDCLKNSNAIDNSGNDNTNETDEQSSNNKRERDITKNNFEK